MSELALLSALEQARLVRERSVSPVELVRAYLDRIDRLDGRIGSYLTVDVEGALRTAKEKELLAAEGSPPFHGVPVSIKDLHNTAGLHTTFGLGCLNGNVPTEDDYVVAQLRRAGFIILGKTNTPALGYGCVTEPSAYFPARNPWNVTRTPGGSSGGAAAALAAGLCAAAHGSDGGGSIRIPAAWCGLVGVKPSRGRISSAPSPSSMTGTSGPITRTVSDAAAMLDVMSGTVLGDAFAAPAPERPFLEEVRLDPRRLRVAVSLGSRAVTPGVAAVLESTRALLAELGHEIIDFDPESEWGRIIERHIGSMMAVGLRSTVAKLPRQDDLDPLIGALMQASQRISADTFAAGMHELGERARTAVSEFANFDVLLSPTVAKPPPPIGAHRELGVAELFVCWESYVPFTTMWNWTGQPALSLPMGVDDEGLPVGMQLVGRPNAEATLFRLAGQLEHARPWAHRIPPLAAV